MSDTERKTMALSGVRGRFRRGLTLLELVVVLVVLVALAAISVPLLTSVANDSRRDTTLVALRQLQDLLLNRYALEMRGVLSSSTSQAVRDGMPGPDPDHLVPSSRQQQPQLAFLFVNPATNDATSTFDPVSRRGWHGPYLTLGHGGAYPGAQASTAVARGFDATYGFAGDDDTAADQTVLDGWGNPIVLQIATSGAATLVSAGPDGDLATTSDNLALTLQ